MDKNEKFIRSLNSKEFNVVIEMVAAIKANGSKAFQSKKLIGYPNMYRVRVSSIRIIYVAHGTYNEIVYVGRRNEKTYKKF